MSSGNRLESPDTPSNVYLVSNAEVQDLGARPVFTGDVFESDRGRFRAIIQHPCAIRRGVQLVPRVLLAEVARMSQGIPEAWSGHYKKSFLPNLFSDGEDWAIDFMQIEVAESSSINLEDRCAIASLQGVNLLLQRWVYHNTRVVTPVRTLSLVTSGPFEEADLSEDAIARLVEAGWSDAEALRRIDAWFGESVSGSSRRFLLEDPQSRGRVRRELRQHVKGLLETAGT